LRKSHLNTVSGESLCEINIHNEWFKDQYGRYLILRGANLSSKIPSHLIHNPFCQEQLYTQEGISYVNHPIPLEEADEHFSRLKYWGFMFLRFSVPWEAIAHGEPGNYDEKYLEYLLAIVTKAKNYGINIFIDFHQDVWSRFSGGSGSPRWTLEKVGFEIKNFEETGASVFNTNSTKIGHLLWATNAYKLATATMFTLFFGGNVFAPHKQIEGCNIQDYLQFHYIESIKQVVNRLKGMKNIVGYDVINEPLAGYIGCDDLSKPLGFFQLGATPTPFQSMMLGEGFTQEIDVWDKKLLRVKKTGTKHLNLKKKRAWIDQKNCIWRDSDVWDIDRNGHPKLLQPFYFKYHKGKKVDFEEDFYKPFLIKTTQAIHSISPNSFVFIENVVGSPPPKISNEEANNVVFTGHWYDGFVLATKKFSSFIGFDMFAMKWVIAFPSWIRRIFALQVYKLKQYAKDHLGSVPTVISEFGIPFDLRDKKAYKTGEFSTQNKALHRSFTAIDDNLASATVWNYTCHNNNLWGDHWNNEDLSIFSRDQQDDTNPNYSGARAKEALIRPYCMKSAGVPLFMNFNLKKGYFEFIYQDDPQITSPTEIFLPDLHFGQGFTVELSDGQFLMNPKTQILRYQPQNKNTVHYIRITKSNYF